MKLNLIKCIKGSYKDHIDPMESDFTYIKYIYKYGITNVKHVIS